MELRASFSLIDELLSTPANHEPSAIGDGSGGDVSIVCRGGGGERRIFVTHRLILASISKLLKSLFASAGDVEPDDPLMESCVIICPDVEDRPMEILLKMLATKGERFLVDGGILELCSLLGIDVVSFLETPPKMRSAQDIQPETVTRIEPLLSHMELDELLKYGEMSEMDCILVVNNQVDHPRQETTDLTPPPPHPDNPLLPQQPGGHEGVAARAAFQCAICQKCFSSEQQLKYHRIIHAGVPLKPTTNKRELGRCLVCSKVMSRAHLYHHLREVHFIEEASKFRCQECGRDFMRREKYEGHMSSRHGAVKRHVCQLCGKQFALNSDLYKHRAQVHLARPALPCSVCGKLLKTRERLRRHELIHATAAGGAAAVAPWQCATCQRTFSRKDKLQAHTRAKHIDLQLKIESHS